MKTFSLVALILLLCSCSAPHHDSTQAVKQFYTSWMTTFTNDVNTPDDTTALMQRYVAKEVIHRLALIQSLYEQEIVGADYFMYAQDYAPEWIPQLRVGKAHPFLGGEKSGCSVGYRVNAHPPGSLYPLGRGTLENLPRSGC
ncbi:putative periplasmic protein [Salmonella enterica subsp. enterica]|nr:putative periplasmic protein [Salmonella enterica subsp. enterica] [Salmonella enterica subsp. enterica serovar Menston]